METARIYKGMDNQLKIRGLYTRYFYICFASLMFSGFLFMFSISTVLKGEGGSSFWVELLVELSIPLVLYKFFYDKSNKEKIVKKPCQEVVTNRQLYKMLNRKK